MNKTIEFLKTLPENSGQKVQMKTSNGIQQFYFMWFYSEKTIDLKPVDRIGIFSVTWKFWDKIELVL